ncbi:MAG: sulfite exporter TauE/SafE family protein [Phycisphaerales bacterium]|nr:sulfite exporter TauE/SafE family protein [Phycisphaerales bacterium]
MQFESSLLLIPLVSFGASLLGALVGLGGGILTIPFLAVALGIDIRIAMGAGLISGIATSIGPALGARSATLLNLRVAVVLELLATSGAIIGATLVAETNARLLSVIFGALMLLVAGLNMRRARTDTNDARGPDALATFLRLDGEVPGPDARPVAYRLRRIPGGALIMLAAGLMSGLLGIANGAVKILAMDSCMGMPPRVSSASSNFMIGITAAGGAIVYLMNGYIDPRLALLTIAGALPGSIIGGRLLPHAPLVAMRTIFVSMISLIGIEMIARGLGARL